MLAVFFVDSMKDLQPNYGALTVDLLSQLSASTQGALPISPSTSPTPELATFHASTTITRVNKLWAASLVISLFVSSMSLILKHWLCKYIAPISPSPQADLHTRHTARQSFWGVIEIVTLLPFVSQIPTALFLYGLCLRTDTNSAVGNMTAMITGGVTSISGLIVYLSLSSPAPYRFPFIGRIFARPRPSISLPLYSADDLSSASSGVNLESALEQFSTMEDDTDVLVAIYAKHREDHVLNAMWDALRESGATPEDHLRFIWRLVSTIYPSAWNPIKHEKGAIVPTSALDLTSVPESTYVTIMINVADRLFEEIQRHTGVNDSKALEWTPWMKQALRLVLADSSYPLPPAANFMLTKVMNSHRANAFLDVSISVLAFDSPENQADGFAYLLNKTHGAITKLVTKDCFEYIASLVRCCFSGNGIGPSKYNQEWRVAIMHHISDIPSTYLHSIGVILLKRLTDDIYPTMFWFFYLVDCLGILLHIDRALSKDDYTNGKLHEGLVKVVYSLLHQPKNFAIFTRSATGLSQEEDMEIETASQLFIEAFVGATPRDRTQILDNARLCLEWQQLVKPLQERNDWDKFVSLHVMKTYLLVLRAVEELDKRNLVPAKETDPEFRRALVDIGYLVSCYLRGTTHEYKLQKDRDPGKEIDRVSKLGEEGKDIYEGPQKSEDKETLSDTTSSEDKITPDSQKASDVDAVPDLDKKVEVIPKQDAKKDATTEAITTSPSPEDIDLAKQCLSLVTSLDPVGLAKDAKDDEFAAWAQAFDTASSFFGDNILEALGEIVPQGDSVASARLRRIQLRKKDGLQGVV
jgi:hypothetical protein